MCDTLNKRCVWAGCCSPAVENSEFCGLHDPMFTGHYASHAAQTNAQDFHREKVKAGVTAKPMAQCQVCGQYYLEENHCCPCQREFWGTSRLKGAMQDDIDHMVKNFPNSEITKNYLTSKAPKKDATLRLIDIVLELGIERVKEELDKLKGAR